MKDEKYFVYILQSLKTKRFYIGSTSDLLKRLDFHNKGLQRYTKRDKPWELVYWEEFKNKKEALLREREIKSKKSRKFIESLIKKKNGE